MKYQQSLERYDGTFTIYKYFQRRNRETGKSAGPGTRGVQGDIADAGREERTHLLHVWYADGIQHDKDFCDHRKRPAGKPLPALDRSGRYLQVLHSRLSTGTLVRT